jgi:hypothetical protein
MQLKANSIGLDLCGMDEPLHTGRYIENPVTRGDRTAAPSRRIHSSRIGTPSADAAIGHHLS